MFNNNVYLNFSNELAQARNTQSLISQKELDLKLLDIKNQYSSGNQYSYTSYLLQKQAIESSISNLKYNRDIHLKNAIDYALTLTEMDILNNNLYSMATAAIGAINSFLYSQNITFKLMFATQLRLSQLYYRVLNAGSMWNNLLAEISNLKVRCGVI